MPQHRGRRRRGSHPCGHGERGRASARVTRSCAVSTSTGSGRSGAGSHHAAVPRGTSWRNDRPSSRGSRGSCSSASGPDCHDQRCPLGPHGDIAARLGAGRTSRRSEKPSIVTLSTTNELQASVVANRSEQATAKWTRTAEREQSQKASRFCPWPAGEAVRVDDSQGPRADGCHLPRARSRPPREWSGSCHGDVATRFGSVIVGLVSSAAAHVRAGLNDSR